MFIEPRKRGVGVDELLRGMIVQSGNDASIALAELVGRQRGRRSSAKMNAEAARLGLTDTRFANATGLSDPQHYYERPPTSAKLAAALIRDYPEFYPIYSQKEFRYNNITQPNRNRLLWTDPFVDGLKTGHTDAAGWCLIASAKRGERRRGRRGAGRELRRRRARPRRRSCSTGASRPSTPSRCTSRASR